MIEQQSIFEIWVYLSGSPLLALFITLAAYQAGLMIYERCRLHPLANPVAIAVLLVAGFIHAIGMSYPRYFEGAKFVHFLLGTATVSLAIPIYRGLNELKDRLMPLLAALLGGGIVAIGSAVGIASVFGAGTDITRSLYAKSVTTPIAMGVADRIGASPTLTAVFAVSSGILGAILARPVLNCCGIKPWWQRGFAVGMAAHGIGTARAFSVHHEAGAYSSLAMGMHGILGAIAIPPLAALVGRWAG
jgi:predicted murein hydrolase (TIGR00659 family)